MLLGFVERARGSSDFKLFCRPACARQTAAVVGIKLSLSAQALPTAMAAAAASGRAPAACALLFLLLLVLGAVAVAVDDASQEEVSPGSPAPAPSPASFIDCGSACAARCAVSSRQNLCRRACGSCCVPPGTAGHHDVCPCYAAITTRAGRPKCP